MDSICIVLNCFAIYVKPNLWSILYVVSTKKSIKTSKPKLKYNSWGQRIIGHWQPKLYWEYEFAFTLWKRYRDNIYSMFLYLGYCEIKCKVTGECNWK